jgi:hypothetical protein
MKRTGRHDPMKKAMEPQPPTIAERPGERPNELEKMAGPK